MCWPILLLAAALGLVLAPAGSRPQPDLRIVHPVSTPLPVETLLAPTRQLCLDFADTDLEADFADWTTRNLEVLRLADVLVRRRERLEPGMLGEMRNAAAGEAETSFARESDRAAFCEGIGQAMEA